MKFVPKSLSFSAILRLKKFGNFIITLYNLIFLSVYILLSALSKFIKLELNINNTISNPDSNCVWNKKTILFERLQRQCFHYKGTRYKLGIQLTRKMNSKKYNGITLMKHENTSLSPGTKVISDYIYIGTFIYTYFAYICICRVNCFALQV